MNRRLFLHALGTLPFAAAAPALPTQQRSTAARAGSRKPNVLFILVDDLGGTDLACYGADLHETPHLDRLALESTRFTHAYAAAPVCSPTRASILTGKYPARLHMTVWREDTLRPPANNRKLAPPRATTDLPLAETTLAETLRDSGYRTAHIGKWHLGDAAHYPEQQGFDFNLGGTLWGAPQTFFYPWRGNKRYGGEPRYVPGIRDGKPGDYLPDRLTDEALAFLDRAGDEPFFLNLWYYTVHTPIEGKPELVDYYKRKRKEGMSHQNAGYAAMVHNMDENVGRVLAKLEEKGLAENTIVVFTSDNGGFVNDFDNEAVTNNAPLRSGKGSLYEGGIRVPLMVRSPGLPKGKVCDVPVVSIDFYPTLAELTGVPIPDAQRATMDGVSFAGLLKNPGVASPRPLFFHYPHYYPTTTPVGAVIAGDWKLLEFFEDGHTELYNLREDPSEARDVSSVERGRAESLQRLLSGWRQAVKAQMPEKNAAAAP